MKKRVWEESEEEREGHGPLELDYPCVPLGRCPFNSISDNMGKEHFHSIRTLLGAILFFSSVCATVLQNAFLDNIRFASE